MNSKSSYPREASYKWHYFASNIILWGVRLGKDSALEQQIAWQLRRSRQTSPLWNAKQFTREMEKAYKQMWQNYCQ